MKNGVRYALLWGPLALTMKNWVIDIRPIEGNTSLHHGSASQDIIQTDIVLTHECEINAKFSLNLEVYKHVTHANGRD